MYTSSKNAGTHHLLQSCIVDFEMICRHSRYALTLACPFFLLMFCGGWMGSHLVVHSKTLLHFSLSGVCSSRLGASAGTDRGKPSTPTPTPAALSYGKKLLNGRNGGGVPAARIRQQVILEIQPKEASIKACFTYCKPNKNIYFG